MKILYITNGITGAGGLERVLSVKCSWLAENYNHEVHILCLNENGKEPFYKFSTDIKVHNIAVLGNPIAYILKYIQGTRRLIKLIKPDVISVCDDGLKAFFLPTILGKSCPIIYERHVSKIILLRDDDSLLKKLIVKMQFLLMGILGQTFDKFVVLTAGNLAEWNFKNLTVIGNPLSFYPEKSSKLNQKKISAVGKQSYQKGYDRLLDTFQIVSQKHPDWHLEIFGKIDPEEQLAARAEKLQIESKVSFYPPDKNIMSKYLESSIYVMSSRFEGFGMVLIEAMACGVPCVSFDCPYGPSDIISDGVDGILVPEGNISELAAAILNLIEDENLRINMGSNAKENVTRYFPELIVKKWDELFKSLVQ